MTFRRFVDKDGIDWEVWEVIPPAVDRRIRERRANADRRQRPRAGATERRTSVRRTRSSPKFVRVSSGFERGWLCFAAGVTVKRLAPVPSGWNEAPSDQLELWVTMASPSWKCSTPK